MARCVICGNDYDRAFQVIRKDHAYGFDSFECAIHFLRRCSSAAAQRAERRRRILLACAPSSRSAVALSKLRAASSRPFASHG